jgi:DNA-binding MurR/RpiR family transcriptional regulator
MRNCGKNALLVMARPQSDTRATAGEKTVAEMIRGNLGRLTPTEKRPALALLANYPVAGLETVAQFARRSGVSGPTVLRLVAKLGLPSYLDFQKRLRDELELRAQAPLAKAPPPERKPKKGDFLGTYVGAIVDNIERSVADVSRADFETVAELLGDPRKRILLLGGRFTNSLAMHFYLHLRELRPRVELVGGQTAAWVEHLLDAGRSDVLVVFDIRRFQDDVVAFAREAAATGARVVLFTDTWVSPIAAVAAHVFAMRTSMPSSWESFAALSALVEALVVRVHQRRWGDSKRRMERLEAFRTHLTAGNP